MAFRLNHITVVLHLLTVCTSQTGPTSTNIALNKVVTQSTIQYSLGPTLAVDGNMDTSFSHCIFTEEEEVNWLTVDLFSEYLIDSVSVTNRGDCGPDCVERLQNFTIEVTTELPSMMPKFPQLVGTFCTHRSSHVGRGSTLVLACERPVIGRYVRLVKFGFNALTLCELEVFGATYSPNGIYQKLDFVSTSPGAVSYPDLRSVVECAYRCNSASAYVCLSFQWNPTTSQCELFDAEISVSNLEPKTEDTVMKLYAKLY